MTKPILAAILSCSGTSLTKEEQMLFAEANPLGITLFARNIKDAAQVKKLVDDIKNVINRDDVLIAVDQEGGRVARLTGLTKQRFVAAENLGKAAVKYCAIHAQLIAHEMQKLGLNVNFAPIVETIVANQSPVLKSRCFSRDVNKIIPRAQIMADTYIQMGICPCIKHLPGHFDMKIDPHLQRVVIGASKNAIFEQIGYLKNFCHYPLAMSSHVVLKSFDTQLPVSMSKTCVQLILRDFLQFNGFLISDAIDMHALNGSILTRAEKCWEAGLDAVCYCSGKIDELTYLCKNGRFLTDNALIRFDKIKKIIHNKGKIDGVPLVRKMYNQRFEKKLDKAYMYDATEVLNKMIEKGEC